MNMKITLLTLGTLALLASPSFAVEDNLQEHLRTQDKLEKKERLKDILCYLGFHL